MSDQGGEEIPRKDVLRMTSSITAAFLLNNPIHSETIGEVIRSVHEALSVIALPSQVEPTKPARRPAIAVSKSVAPNYIVCLEDGRRMKMLKRHLKAAYGLTPEEYRQRWGLPADYPMVAPRYAQQRSQFAKQMGLGKSRSGSK